MRRFLIKTFLLLLPILVIAVFCEFSHGLHGNVYKYKNKSLSKLASNIQILSLGSSHGFYGIDPTQFDLRTFNAAHESQDIHFDEFIFDSFFDRMDSLQYLILPISYFSPWSVIEDQEEHWRVKYYQIYYHYPIKLFELKNCIEISSGLRLCTALQEFRLLFNKQTVTELGQGTSNKKQNRSDDWKNSGIIRAKYHYFEKLDIDNYQANLSRVRRMIEKCRTKSVTVLLVTTPTYITYRANLDEDQLSQTRSFCQTLENEYDNVHYIDMLADLRFSEDDFYDADHLNEFGAAKLSCILNQLIVELTTKQDN